MGIASSPASDSDPDSAPEPQFHPPHGYTTTWAAAAGVSLFALVALSIMAVVAVVKHRERRQQANVSASGSRSSSRGTLRVVQGSTAPASPGEARVNHKLRSDALIAPHMSDHGRSRRAAGIARARRLLAIH